MERLNLDRLLDLVDERTQSVIEIDFADETLKVCDAESLPQKHRLSLARAQAELQDYYSAVLKEQEDAQSRLNDETLSATQRAAYQRESTESAVNIAMKMLSASQALLQSNVNYIESLAQLAPGKLMELIGVALDKKGVEGDRREIITAMLVARASQLIRTALDDTEKNFQDSVLAVVRERKEVGAIVIPMLNETLETNGKKQKNTSAVAS